MALAVTGSEYSVMSKEEEKSYLAIFNKVLDGEELEFAEIRRLRDLRYKMLMVKCFAATPKGHQCRGRCKLTNSYLLGLKVLPLCGQWFDKERKNLRALGHHCTNQELLEAYLQCKTRWSEKCPRILDLTWNGAEPFCHAVDKTNLNSKQYLSNLWNQKVFGPFEDRLLSAAGCVFQRCFNVNKEDSCDLEEEIKRIIDTDLDPCQQISQFELAYIYCAEMYHWKYFAEQQARTESFCDYIIAAEHAIQREFVRTEKFLYKEAQCMMKKKLFDTYIKPCLNQYTSVVVELKRTPKKELIIKAVYEHMLLGGLKRLLIEKITECHNKYSCSLKKFTSFVNYVNQIQPVIQIELHLSSLNFTPKLTLDIQKFLIARYIEPNLNLYHDLIVELMQNKNYDQLATVYEQVKLAGKVDFIVKHYKECYFEASLEKLRQLKTFETTKAKFKAKKISEIWQSIYLVYESLSEVVRVGCKDEPELKETRDKMMIALLNHVDFKWQTVCSLDVTIFSIFFVTFANVLLREASATRDKHSTLEKQMKQLCTLLKYINEKDYFTRIYRSNLARRLLQTSTIDYDYQPEEMAVNELRSIGIPVGKMVHMIQDSKISYDFCRKKKSELKNAKNEGERVPDWVTARFLRQHCWTNVIKDTKATLKYPPGVEQALEKISRCYRSSFPNRNLTWHAPFSTAELTFYTESGTCYTLEVTSYQAMVLCAWNERDHSELSVDSLHLHTGIPKSQLRATLWSLVDSGKPNSNKSSILLVVGKPVKSWHAITDSTTFRLNFHFKCHKRKVNLIGQLPIHQQLLKDEAEGLVQTRRILLQSAILQALKKHQTLSENQIYLKSAKILHWAFAPTKQDTVELINQLVSQDEVTRDENDPN